MTRNFSRLMHGFSRRSALAGRAILKQGAPRRTGVGAVALIAAGLVCAAAAQAAPLLNLQYDGAFQTPSNDNVDFYGHTGLAYYVDPVYGETLFTTSYYRFSQMTTAAPVMPNALWDNLNQGANVIAPHQLQDAGGANIGDQHGGLVLRDDGGATGLVLYALAGQQNGRARQVDLGLAGVPTLMGEGKPDNNYPQGFSPVNPAFVQALIDGGVTGLTTDMDTLWGGDWYSQPYIGLCAPQQGDGTTYPQKRLLRFASNTGRNSYVRAIEWVQTPGTTAWQDGVIVLIEVDKTDGTTELSLYDAETVYDVAVNSNGVRDQVPDEVIDVTALLSPGSTAGLLGLTYDPVEKKLYAAENSGNPGDVIHVWTVVPEPATLALLSLGVLPLLRRRRR